MVVLNFHSKLYSPEKLDYNPILLFWDSKIAFHITYKGNLAMKFLFKTPGNLTALQKMLTLRWEESLT